MYLCLATPIAEPNCPTVNFQASSVLLNIDNISILSSTILFSKLAILRAKKRDSVFCRSISFEKVSF